MPRPTRPVWQGVAPPGESPSGLFAEFVSEQVVQAKCVSCHVEGGVSGHTRLVLSPSSVEDHEELNLAVFETLLSTVDDAADLILNKIRGVGHGGGIQVPARSADFSNMERFLRLLGGGSTSGSVSPETLFEGVTMASPAKTLRRAALLFAGRLPTQVEISAVNDGQVSSLRRTIRELMTGPGFHAFLIRASNDRLLTDRQIDEGVLDINNQTQLVGLVEKVWEVAKAARDRGYESRWDDPEYHAWKRALFLGVARAPLELIAYIIENDLSYTEVLKADYIMANPFAAEGYGAATEFINSNDPMEFKPSEISSYYRDDYSKVIEEDPSLRPRPFPLRVINPGNLSTDYPHAGILNTTVFLLRYPTTATNRNRARSRWTYYHFLGLDIEKSAARTTDPEALADNDNPTMKNPACTVCHSVLDPVAGAFQNYGSEGHYRDQWGGFDSLAQLYKHPEDGSESAYQESDTWYRDMREPGFGRAVAPSADNSLQWLAEQIVADRRFAEATVRFWWPAVMGVEVAPPPESSDDRDFEARVVASTAQAAEVARLGNAFRLGIAGGPPFNAKHLLTEMALSPWFRAESLTGADPVRDEALRDVGVERLLTPEELQRKTEAVSGYVWGRSFERLTEFGLGEARSNLNDPKGDIGYGLLYGGIDSDGITTRARDMTPLMAAVAQSHAAEVSCPIVVREFFFWSDRNRRLFDGIDRFDTPVSEVRGEFEVTAESWEARQTISLETSLGAGSKIVRIDFTNPFQDHEGNDRILKLDRFAIRDRSGVIVSEVEFESLGSQKCGRPAEQVNSFYMMWNNCSLEVPVRIAYDDFYQVDVVAHQDRVGTDSARFAVTMQSEDGSSRGAMAIRRKLVDLHQELLGVTVATDSPDVEAAYRLFVEVWDHKRRTEGSHFHDSGFLCATQDDHLYYEGLIDDVVGFGEGGDSRLNWDLLDRFYDGIDMSDPHYSIRTWVVTLAYLLTDYRYLYF